MTGVLSSVLLDGRDDRPNNLSDWDYIQLCRTLEKLVAEGKVRKVPAFNPLHSGVEEWFLDVESGEVYSLTPSAERVSPVWEKVDVYDRRDWRQKQKDWQIQMGEVERAPGYLAPIGTGRKDTADLCFIRDVLPRYIAAGKVEAVEIKDSSPIAGNHCEWYKDKTTGEIFGLVRDENGEYRWVNGPH